MFELASFKHNLLLSKQIYFTTDFRVILLDAHELKNKSLKHVYLIVKWKKANVDMFLFR